MKRIEIFDIDGTITKYFGDITDTSGLNTYDLWQNTTLQLVPNKSLFEDRVHLWKKSMTNGENPVTASYDMMLDGINMLDPHINQKDIFNAAKEISVKFHDHHIIYKKAISYLKHRINTDTLCILSTANYTDGAHGFVDALVETGLLTTTEVEKILVSGSVIDWNRREIKIFNVGDNKVTSINSLLKNLPDCYLENIEYSFGDDPIVNDSGILKLAKKQGFVIENCKNKHLEIPQELIKTSWDHIYKTLVK